MSTVEFVQFALREKVAPPSVGSVKARQRYAQRVLREWIRTNGRAA